jgi:hypothetical protein
MALRFKGGFFSTSYYLISELYQQIKFYLQPFIYEILYNATMINKDNDENQPYGKLKRLEIVTLLGVLVIATIFILLYFNQ